MDVMFSLVYFLVLKTGDGEKGSVGTRVRVRTVREVLEALVLDLKLKGVAEELGVILLEREESEGKREGRGGIFSSCEKNIPARRRGGAKKNRSSSLRLRFGEVLVLALTLEDGQRDRERGARVCRRRSRTHQHLHLRHVDGAHLSRVCLLIPRMCKPRDTQISLKISLSFDLK